MVFRYVNILSFPVAEKEISIGVIKSQRIPGNNFHLRDVAATSADVHDIKSNFSFRREIRKEK